jgi:sulfonate transport system substrate-binding protein
VLAAGSCRKTTKVRIGYQKYGILLVLKAQGTLDRALAPSNVQIEWSEFPSGPPMMEAFHAGKIDFGVAGEAPPVFAQATGAAIVYVASDPPAPRAEAILVRRESSIRRVADLRGKRVALNRGSNVHYLLASALADAGVKYSDVTLDFLPPSDARAAFESGNVDAWVIWDPFLAAVLHSSNARVLRDGTGVAENVPFYLATSAFATQHADLVRDIVAQIKLVDAYVSANPHDVASLLATVIGMPPAAIEDSLQRNTFDIRPISPEVVGKQQRVADTFFELGLLPAKVHVADIVSPVLN